MQGRPVTHVSRSSEYTGTHSVGSGHSQTELTERRKSAPPGKFGLRLVSNLKCVCVCTMVKACLAFCDALHRQRWWTTGSARCSRPTLHDPCRRQTRPWQNGTHGPCDRRGWAPSTFLVPSV
eukprot:3176084-Prymnesium_polylepis.1